MNTYTDDRLSEAERPDAAAQRHPGCKVSIVMPCLNEAESLAPCVKKAMDAIERTGLEGEVLVADNGSTDGSVELAQSLGARVVHVSARGYGSALQGGFAAANGEYILMGDADGSYDFGHLDRFVKKLDEGYDLVMGNRFAGGIASGAMPPLHQYFGNPGISWLGRLFFGAKVGDFYCGLRAFRRDVLPKLELQSPGMELGVEMVAKAALYGLRVSEVPTTLSPDLRSRPPHLRTWRDGWRTLRFFLLYSPRWLFFYPGALLMLVGLILGIALLPGPLELLGARLDVHTLLYAGAAVVVGFQACLFAVMARLYATSEGFLPANELVRRARRAFSLEIGLLIGALLILASAVLSVIALVRWGGSSFKHLDYTDTMRIVIPAVVALMLGVQTIFSSFFLSVLGIKQNPKS
ncbi:MAG: glycosyltransferase family 2 protein [Solirubrobacterales bacterium]|nr:glycosyltransferase family 2 protein [Solirubrobacterales bacterium]